MADRSVATTNTLNYFRHEYNATSADVGSIQSILDATGIIASATDVVESVTSLNTDLTSMVKALCSNDHHLLSRDLFDPE